MVPTFVAYGGEGRISLLRIEGSSLRGLGVDVRPSRSLPYFAAAVIFPFRTAVLWTTRWVIAVHLAVVLGLYLILLFVDQAISLSKLRVSREFGGIPKVVAWHFR